MDNPVVNFLSLAAFVYYPSIPLVIILAHKALLVWRPLGKKSYWYFIALFLILDLIALGLMLNYRETLLSWRLYQSSLALLGLIPFGLGIAVGVTSVRTLTWRVLLGFPEIDPETEKTALVTRGVYHYIRHPRYLEFILETLGIAILGGLGMNFTLFVYMMLMLFLSAKFEEGEMIGRFGQEYIDYRTRTGTFLPKI